MTAPNLRVIADDLRAVSGVMDKIASGFFNDGGGPILKSVTSADSELDSTKACGEVGDIFQTYAQTLGEGVSEHSRKLSAAAGHYERGDTAGAEAIEFDPPEERELEVGDDPGEPGYDPVNEYEDALHDAGLLDGPSSGMYREWLQNAADNNVPPETIVEIARQQNITPSSFDVLKGLERVTNKNDETNPKDDTDYFMLPENVSAEQARQAALIPTYSTPGPVTERQKTAPRTTSRKPPIQPPRCNESRTVRQPIVGATTYLSARAEDLPPHRTAC
ncbi:hypothetical protein [Mycolicibacterium fortuitum]|uniref:hypothetical protein n=1 Tax=Mycolicibacterium fortuitum TaxID=1766 RepID=UPI002625DEED|nr:hypothetical protein [Mycolicibacterium fortuitum]